MMCSAQWDLFFDGEIPVQRQGVPLDLAWSGGINYGQVGLVDLDQDGLKDVVIFDRFSNTMLTLLNTGAPGVMGYRVSRAFDGVHPFSALHDWVLFRDYNCDGKEDIFSYSNAGFAVHKNTSDANGLSFELVSQQVRSTYVSPSGATSVANLFVSQVDLPGIADVDGDGDLDVLTFQLLGSYLEYHRNLSMELYGNCDSLKYEVRNSCWGYFAENFSNNSVTLNAPCQFNVPDPEIDGGGDGARTNEEDGAANKAQAHAGSSVTPLDLDGDGDMDLLLGDISYNNLVALYNGGTASSGIMTAKDSIFPVDDVPVDLPVFPAGFHLDIDKDGNKDLLVCPNATSLAHDYESLWYYRNHGTDLAPQFELEQRNLFQDRSIELGEGAYPVPFDQNGDGLMDLFVANHGYYASGGLYIGKIALLLNIGTASHPAFDLVTDDFMGLSTSGIGASMYPAFSDVDGDGDQDMYIGDLQGRMHFFRNTATGPVAQFQLEQANITDAGGAVIDVGQHAAPQFHDLDGDLLEDLIIGERNGNLNYYRNTGNSTSPTWTLMNEDLGGVSTVEYWNITGYSVPFIFRNAAGQREILLGSESGWLYHYGGIEGNIGGTWTLLDSTFLDIHDGARTGLCLYDFTGDGALDMVLGNFRGGLSFWRSDAISGIAAHVNGQASFIIAPNPGNGQVELQLGQAVSTGQWVLRDVLGQVVLRTAATGSKTRLDLSGIASGTYLVRLEGPAPTATQRLVVAHGDR